MNRTLLLFIMIGCAMIIMVIGDRSPDQQTAYAPWDVKTFENGNTTVFGITLNKTQLQDANQIFSSFPVNQFKTDSFSQRQMLVAGYNALNFSGLIADIDLEYKLSAEELDRLRNIASQNDAFKLPDVNELELLGTAISAIHYRPTIDYDIDMLIKYFGPPDSKEQVNENIEYWHYPHIGLKITLNHAGQEEFSYSPVTVPGTQETD